MADTAIFDVDGTLVDTNYQHTLAWFRAFRRYGINRPMWRIHRGIGMGGDMFVPEVAGSIFDAQAAAKLSIPVIGIRTGGFSVGELQEAGVLQVFDSLVAFRHALDGTPLARASR
jgi:phosphoglycolate phosphatase-like HAD superfamily hydrolase